MVKRGIKAGAILFFILPVLFAIPAIADIYSESFTASTIYTAGSPQYDNWDSFRTSIDAGTDYKVIRMYGSNEPVGKMCKGTDANTMCQALGTASGQGFVTCDGNNWSLCDRYGGELWSGSYQPTVQCAGANCPNPGWMMRPQISFGPGWWGGINNPVCGGAVTQGFSLFSYLGPQARERDHVL